MAVEDKQERLKPLGETGGGKAAGAYGIYDDGGDRLPDGLSAGRVLENLLADLDENGVDLIDEPAKDKDDTEVSDDFPDLEFVQEVSDKTTDPVRMYLREMGTVPLLNREGEIELAKRIERGQSAVMKVLSRSPLVVGEVIRLAAEIESGAQNVRDVLQLPDPPLTDEFIDEEGVKLVAAIGEVEKNYKKAIGFQQKLLSISRTHEAQAAPVAALGSGPHAWCAFPARCARCNSCPKFATSSRMRSSRPSTGSAPSSARSPRRSGSLKTRSRPAQKDFKKLQKQSQQELAGSGDRVRRHARPTCAARCRSSSAAK